MKLVFDNGNYIDFDKGVWVGLKAIVVAVLLILMLAIVGDWNYVTLKQELSSVE